MMHTYPRVFGALDGNIDESASYRLFNRFVMVYSPKIIMRTVGARQSESIGFGFVEVAGADLAVALELNGFYCSCQRSTPRIDRAN
jgi:hypothetical protein